MSRPRFQDLVEQHGRLIHKVARAYCRNPSDRNDVVQEIVVQLWRSYDRYDGKRRLSTWLYRIALNAAISHYRRERRHGDQREPLIEIADDASAPDPDIDALYRFIDTLGELDRALVLLHLDGRDHAEIADVLGISVSNTGTKLGRIKQKLRDAFAREDSIDG